MQLNNTNLIWNHSPETSFCTLISCTSFPYLTTPPRCKVARLFIRRGVLAGLFLLRCNFTAVTWQKVKNRPLTCVYSEAGDPGTCAHQVHCVTIFYFSLQTSYLKFNQIKAPSYLIFFCPAQISRVGNLSGRQLGVCAAHVAPLSFPVQWQRSTIGCTYWLPGCLSKGQY